MIARRRKSNWSRLRSEKREKQKKEQVKKGQNGEKWKKIII